MFVARFQCQTCANPLEINSSLLNIEKEVSLAAFTQSHAKSLDESFELLLPATPPPVDTSESDIDCRISVAQKHFEILSATSIVNHPLCKECSDELIQKYDAKHTAIQAENDILAKYLNNLPPDINTDSLQLELDQLEKQEKEAIQMLNKLQAEEHAVNQQLNAITLEADRLTREEQAVWKTLNKEQADLDARFMVREDALSNLASTAHQLKILKHSNLYHDAFRISHEGPFGTINNLRLGRLPGIPVEWNEINAAIGQALFLLDVLARKLKFEFKK